jgi:hypothetical protein
MSIKKNNTKVVTKKINKKVGQIINYTNQIVSPLTDDSENYLTPLFFDNLKKLIDEGHASESQIAFYNENTQNRK